MTMTAGKLTMAVISALQAPGRYNDGDGLYLYVSKTGNRSWVFRYRDRTSGKLRDKGLGAIRQVTLEQAREAARAARSGLRNGVDPIPARPLAHSPATPPPLQHLSFDQCQERYLEARKPGWRNAKHAAQWRSTLRTHAARLLPLPVAAIDTAAVLSTLEPIWAGKTETATRLRQRIEAVLDWATAGNHRSGANPARWKGHLDRWLARPATLKTVTPRAALAYPEIGAFVQALRQRDGMAARALELQILTAARPGAVAAARWKEFDLDDAVWTVPAARMKSGSPHRIPLAPAALALLKGLPHLGEFTFPGSGRNACMTTAAPLKLLKDLRPGLTAHGFRGTFRDWAADMTAYPREIAEQALGHASAVSAAGLYRRDDVFERRTKLMHDWARYCDTPETLTAKVSSLAHARRRRGP